MNRSKAALLTCLVASLIARSIRANDDWPQWMGVDMRGIVSDTDLLDSFSESGPKVLWRQPIGAGYTGPSVVGDHIYVMDRTKDEGKGKDVENNIRNAGEVPGGERVLCLSATNGEVVWEHTYNCPYKIAYPTGPRCTPTVAGDHVYTLGAMGHLICFDRMSGKIAWQKDLQAEYDTKPPIWGFSSHPVVEGNQLIVPVGGDGSAIVSFDRMTGEEKWRALTTMDVAYAPVRFYEIDGERQLIFWHAEGIDSLDPETGKEFWHVKFPEQQNQSQTSIATPRIVGNQIFISEYYKGSLLLEVGSNPPSVKELWRSYKTDPRHSSGLNSMMTTPAIKDGYVYGIGYNGRGQGVLRCLELETGEMKWTRDDWMGEEPVLFGTAFIIENQDRYLMFNDIGELMIVELSPEGFTELDRAKILEPTGVARGRKVVWSHPAFFNGKMVARNDKEIVCIDLKK